MDETPKSRQENELLVLTSIYCEDVKDLRTGNKWKPLDLLIKLKPQQGSISTQDVYVNVDLHIVCPPQYPNQIPQISVENGKGLSQSTLDKLRSELVDIARGHKGNEMILELCQYVQEFLHKHNKPSSKSFYEEMQQRRQKEEMQSQQAKQLEEDRKRKSGEEEINKIYSRLEADNKMRKKTNSETEEIGSSRRDSLLSERGKNGDMQCTHKPIENISFDSNGSRDILRAKCLKHSSNNRSVYTGIDKETGENFIINEWKFDIKNYEPLQISKQINSIEQEFSHITKLRHKNLALYHNFSFIIDDFYIVQILKEFIRGSNCQSLFSAPKINADIQYIKHIANGVLQALDYLHKKNVIHRDIKDSCIYINNKGIVKMSNYSINRRLSDLAENPHPTSSYGKKTDIFKFGTFVLGLLQGSFSIDVENIKIPETLPADLYDLLEKCLCKDEKDRWNVIQLLNHQFFNQKPQLHFKIDQKIEPIPNVDDLPNDFLQKDVATGSRNQSRINTEFEFLENIGEGAYGSVKKYKNKLDGRFYAIKRIELKPKNKQLNKKIVREVQLLSRLNHENVVRYYNSWIETSEVDENNRSDSRETTISNDLQRKPIVKGFEEFTINDNIEELAPPIKNTKVSITYDSKSQVPYEDSTSDSESSEDEESDSWHISFKEQSESDGIEFEETKDLSIENNDDVDQSTKESMEKNVIKIDYMYIQMEFCEKSTLKSAIEDDLYKDENRVQRLFREILEGLAHIHQQGMIHRDLKPFNIFLDSRDQVKIGDFGLATMNLKSKINENPLTKSAIESLKEDVDESKTGYVGTPFYVAPELDNRAKVNYNEKVDIYSLGIILFEMCYRPPATAMERFEILEKVRHKDIIFPKDYEKTLVGKHGDIIRWLLNHDASKRPTSFELLQSSLVPPPILEERELKDLIRHTLDNPQTKGYKYLVASCFNQKFSTAQDITYEGKSNVASKPLEIYYEIVKRIAVKVFRKHGGQNLSTPLLMPKSKFYNKRDNCVKLMTHDGSVVCLPYDLRVPFARYIVWNHISLFRRYSIERVYREIRVFGFIPRELYECAFDIVTPTPGNLISDGEILCIVQEIITQLPVLKYKTIHLHLNHTLLLKAILLYYGIKEGIDLCISKFTDYKENKIKDDELLSFLLNEGLSENQIVNLYSLLVKNNYCEASKMNAHFQMITRKNNTEYSKFANMALQELKTIMDIAEKMGFNMEIFINPGLMYNIQQYSGMLCQFVCEKKSKHKKLEVLAAGGRYDAMISHYRNMQKQYIIPKANSQSAVGISISLDKLVLAIQKEETVDGDTVGHFDVLVCSVGTSRGLSQKLKVLKCLSNADIRWTLLETTNNKEIEEHREELKVPHIIILKDTDDKVILRSWEKDRFQEKTYTISELIEDVHKLVKRFPLSESNHENVLPRTDSKNYVEKSQNSDSVSIVFHTSEKILSATKKRYEISISSQLSDVFDRLVGSVVVLALNIDINVMKTLAATLEFQTDDSFQKSVDSVIERHPRYKKVLGELCDVIFEHKNKPTKPFLILYSLVDWGYKLLT